MGIAMSFLAIGAIAAMESLRRADARREQHEFQLALEQVNQLAGGAK